MKNQEDYPLVELCNIINKQESLLEKKDTYKKATSSKEKLDVAFEVSRRCLEKRGARRDISARNQWR